MYINWSTPVPGPGGVPIPTYGNYGGPGYSDGEILTVPNQPVAYDSPPVDDLDALFLIHDQAYDSSDPIHRAEGDLELAQGIAALSDNQLDAEASLYGGLATLFAINLILTVNKQPDLLTLGSLVSFTQSAVHDIERGLALSDPNELAAIQSWLAQTVSAVVDGPTDPFADAGRVFDFSQLANWSAPETNAVDFALADLTSLVEFTGEATTILHDSLAPVLAPALDKALAGLLDVMLEHHHGAALYNLLV